MEIGTTLREAREQHNYSLDDIQEKTKIQKRYLIAIENNNFDTLPGRFYARAFIKEYAQVVGLDVVELLADFDEDNIVDERTEVVQSSRLNRMKKDNTGGTSRLLSLLPTVIVVLLVIGILFVAWTLIDKSKSNEGNDTPGESDHIVRKPGQESPDSTGNGNASETNDEEATEEEGVENTEPTFEATDIGTGNSPTSDMTFTYTGDKVEVVFEPTGTTYIDLKGETENYIGQTLTNDMEPITFDITEETGLYMNIGYTPGLKITINDVLLEYPADAAHQKINLKLLRED